MNKQKYRIGNWVAFKKKPKGGFDYTTLTKSCFEGNYIEKMFKEIPLSEDWFFRFRFETDQITFWKDDFNVGFFGDGFYFLPNGLSSERGDKIDTVHFLQNLYSIKTGLFLSNTL